LPVVEEALAYRVGIREQGRAAGNLKHCGTRAPGHEALRTGLDLPESLQLQVLICVFCYKERHSTLVGRGVEIQTLAQSTAAFQRRGSSAFNQLQHLA
jgi:hypothetical protein